MSKVTKRKHVFNEALWDDFELPKENQTVVKLLKSVGNNLHEVTTPSGEVYLVSMPTKFRKNIWVKRGDYILVEPIAEGNKVKAEIVNILNKDSIKYYKQCKVWPKEFEDKQEIKTNTDEIFVNTNRKHQIVIESCSDTTESESEADSASDSDTK